MQPDHPLFALLDHHLICPELSSCDAYSVEFHCTQGSHGSSAWKRILGIHFHFALQPSATTLTRTIPRHQFQVSAVVTAADASSWKLCSALWKQPRPVASEDGVDVANSRSQPKTLQCSALSCLSTFSNTIVLFIGIAIMQRVPVVTAFLQSSTTCNRKFWTFSTTCACS